MKRAVVIASIAVMGLTACGDNANSPTPAGTQVTTDNTTAMTDHTAMTDGSTSTSGG